MRSTHRRTPKSGFFTKSQRIDHTTASFLLTPHLLGRAAGPQLCAESLEGHSDFIIENDEVESIRSEKRVFLIAHHERHLFLTRLFRRGQLLCSSVVLRSRVRAADFGADKVRLLRAYDVRFVQPRHEPGGARGWHEPYGSSLRSLLGGPRGNCHYKQESGYERCFECARSNLSHYTRCNCCIAIAVPLLRHL